MARAARIAVITSFGASLAILAGGALTGASEVEVRAALGSTTAIVDGAWKDMSYADLGIEIILVRGRAYALTLVRHRQGALLLQPHCESPATMMTSHGR